MKANARTLVVMLMVIAGVFPNSLRAAEAASSNNDLSHRYVVFVDGIGSSSSASTTPCSTMPANPDSNTNICLNNDFADVRANLLSSYPSLTPSHVVYFSYGGLDTQYFCQAWGGAGACSGTGTSNPGSEDLSNLTLSPAYTSDKTKVAPSLQSAVLEWLLGQIVKRDPSASIDLVTYSLGGVVSSYWTAYFAQTGIGGVPPLQSYIHSLILLESPIGGIPSATEFLNCGFFDVMCNIWHNFVLDNLFGDDVLRELQTGAVQGSIVNSLSRAPSIVPITAIQSGNDYVVNGLGIPVCGSVFDCSTVVGDVVGVGAQNWTSPYTSHIGAPLGGSLATQPFPPSAVGMATAGAAILRNHGAPLHQKQTYNWVNQAVGGPTADNWSVALGASQTTVPVGTTVTLSAQANKSVNGGKSIQILDQTHNNAPVPSTCTSTTCSAQVSSDSPTQITYTAEIVTADGAVLNQQIPQAQVTWAQTNPSSIVNGDFSLGNTGFQSSYTYSASSLYAEGTYSVGTNPNNFHSAWPSMGDHTTGSGQMMIVNGGSVAGQTVWSETVSVSPNTLYTFGVWMASLYADPARLQLYVNGAPVGSPFVAPDQPSQWAQYAASWQSGTNTTAVLSVVDENTDYGGNDFALDDISWSQ